MGVCVCACARVIECARTRTTHLSSDDIQPTARTSTRATTEMMANLTDEQDDREHDEDEEDDDDDDDRDDGGDHEDALRP